MAHPERYTVEVITANSSVDPFYTPILNGFLYAVNYRPTATTPWPATADFRLETTDSSVVCFTSKVQLTTGGWLLMPRLQTHNSSGAALQYTTAAAQPLQTGMLPVVDQRLKYTVYNVTSTGMTGNFDFFVDGTVHSTDTA